MIWPGPRIASRRAFTSSGLREYHTPSKKREEARIGGGLALDAVDHRHVDHVLQQPRRQHRQQAGWVSISQYRKDKVDRLVRIVVDQVALIVVGSPASYRRGP